MPPTKINRYGWGCLVSQAEDSTRQLLDSKSALQSILQAKQERLAAYHQSRVQHGLGSVAGNAPPGRHLATSHLHDHSSLDTRQRRQNGVFHAQPANAAGQLPAGHELPRQENRSDLDNLQDHLLRTSGAQEKLLVEQPGQQPQQQQPEPVRRAGHSSRLLERSTPQPSRAHQAASMPQHAPQDGDPALTPSTVVAFRTPAHSRLPAPGFISPATDCKSGPTVATGRLPGHQANGAARYMQLPFQRKGPADAQAQEDAQQAAALGRGRRMCAVVHAEAPRAAEHPERTRKAAHGGRVHSAAGADIHRMQESEVQSRPYKYSKVSHPQPSAAETACSDMDMAMDDPLSAAPPSADPVADQRSAPHEADVMMGPQRHHAGTPARTAAEDQPEEGVPDTPIAGELDAANTIPDTPESAAKPAGHPRDGRPTATTAEHIMKDGSKPKRAAESTAALAADQRQAAQQAVQLPQRPQSILQRNIAALRANKQHATPQPAARESVLADTPGLLSNGPGTGPRAVPPQTAGQAGTAAQHSLLGHRATPGQPAQATGPHQRILGSVVSTVYRPAASLAAQQPQHVAHPHTGAGLPASGLAPRDNGWKSARRVRKHTQAGNIAGPAHEPPQQHPQQLLDPELADPPAKRQRAQRADAALLGHEVLLGQPVVALAASTSGRFVAVCTADPTGRSPHRCHITVCCTDNGKVEPVAELDMCLWEDRPCSGAAVEEQHFAVPEPEGTGEPVLVLSGMLALEAGGSMHSAAHEVLILAGLSSEQQIGIGLRTELRSCCVLAHGQHDLFAAGDMGSLRHWHMCDDWSACAAEHHLPPARYRGVAFPDISCLAMVDVNQGLLAGCSSIGSVAVWDVNKGQLLMAHQHLDFCLAGLAACPITFSAAPTATAELATSGLLLLSLLQPRSCGLPNAQPSGTQAAGAGSRDLRIASVVLTGSRCSVGDRFPMQDVTCLKTCGRLGIVGTASGAVCFWDVVKGKTVAVKQCQGSVASLLLSADGSHLLIGTRAGSLTILDLACIARKPEDRLGYGQLN